MGRSDIAKKYWREFEKLCVELIVGQFRVIPDIVYVTKPTRDGGVDGVIKHHLLDPEFNNSENVTLLEAKLRVQKTSIGLSVFATTLVVAFNWAASMLIVITNQRFSSDAYKQAYKFKEKTNLRVILVEGNMLATWVSDNFHTLAKSFPIELLDFICSSEKILDKPEKLKPGQGHNGIDSKNTDKFGKVSKRKNCSLAACEIIADTTKKIQTDKIHPLSLIGHRRIKLVNNLKIALSRGSGIALVSGTAGVGKSVVISHVVHSMRQESRPISIINLGHVIGSRQLFVKILSELSGIDIAEVFGSKSDKADFSKMLDQVGGNRASKPMRDAVQSVLSETVEIHTQRRDLNEQLLIEYLEKAMEPFGKRVRPIIICQDLNRSSKEMLDFLLAVCRRLANVGVTFVIEVRNEHHSEVLSANEWAGYISSYRQVSNLGEFTINPLTNEETDEYLSELIPGLGNDRYDIIRRRVGTVPLFLYATSLWLKEHEIVSQSPNLTLIEELERFFDGISPDESILVLRLVLEASQQRYGSQFSDCIAAVLFLGSRLNQDIIACIVPDIDPVVMAETLLTSGIFIYSQTNSDSVEIIHDLMIDVVRSIVSPIRLARVAGKLLQDLDSLIADTGYRQAVRAELLMALSRWQQAFTEALACGRELVTQRQWAQAAKYLEMAYNSSQHFEIEQIRIQSMIHALLEHLEVECLRYRIGLDQNLKRIDSLATAITFIDKDVNDDLWQLVMLRLWLVQWRAHYVHEDFAAALTIAKKAKILALSMSTENSLEIRGKALSNFAVTLKVLDKRYESIDSFDTALKTLPDSITVQAERLSNIAAFALRDNPKYARECYIKLLDITQGTQYSFLEIIHAHVDLAMTSFLMQNYESAAEEAIIALRLAESNGVNTQEGRAWNIIGSCHWASDNLKDAAIAFDSAAFASERAVSRRFLWRIRTNCAGTALELGDNDDAIHFAQSAEALILKPRISSFSDLQSDSTHYTSRWYVALLVIAKYYKNLNSKEDLSRLLGLVTLPHFSAHTEEFFANEFPEDVFTGTTHRHGNRIIITG